jgi:hypothetical protein
MLLVVIADSFIELVNSSPSLSMLQYGLAVELAGGGHDAPKNDSF